MIAFPTVAKVQLYLRGALDPFPVSWVALKWLRRADYFDGFPQLNNLNLVFLCQ